MLAALMHLNREGDAVDPDDSIPGTPTDEESAAKRRKFKQITLSNQWRAVASTKKATPSARATLVVCPVSLASQWESELTKMSSPGSLRSVMWHGNDRKDIELLLAQEGKQKVDVIITSYGTLASEHAKWNKEKDKSTYEGGNIFDCKCLAKRLLTDKMSFSVLFLVGHRFI
jgi:DNA repair protein RAD5